MHRRNLFLRTKLLPPRSVPDLLERPRLLEKLRENLDAPLTVVAADAGYGKTTLVAGFLRGVERPGVWYQLDHTDADPLVFTGYIIEGIRAFVPDFGKNVLRYLADAGEELHTVPERAADLLLNEIFDSVEQPFILVLDDYHHIGPETVVHTIVDRLTQYGADALHVIITTRDLPPLALLRRRMQKSALVITRDDLLFTDDEMRELFRQTLGTELGEGEIARYRERTHGWITALQLVRQVAEKETAADRASAGLLARSERDIFDYFAEEVFNREPPEVKEMLLRLSLADSLDVEACEQLFRICDAV